MRWYPLKGTDRVGGCAHQATFNHLPPCLTKEVPAAWRFVSETPIYKKCWKKDLGNYCSISLTLVLGKAMEQIILSTLMQPLQDNQGIRINQQGFGKSKSCLTNLISIQNMDE